MFLNNLKVSFVTTKKAFVLNNWQHLAVTANQVSQRIYINGSLVQETACNKSLPGIIKTSNYIGNFYKQNANYELDDLKIFKRLLESKEIQDDFY